MDYFRNFRKLARSINERCTHFVFNDSDFNFIKAILKTYDMKIFWRKTVSSSCSLLESQRERNGGAKKEREA